jgi:hypothetical protein
MSNGRRKHHEADKLPPWSEELFRAMQMRIAQELRKRYALPEELPRALDVLLMRKEGTTGQKVVPSVPAHTKSVGSSSGARRRLSAVPRRSKRGRQLRRPILPG